MMISMCTSVLDNLNHTHRIYEIRQRHYVACLGVRPPVESNVVQERFRKDALFLKLSNVEISFSFTELLVAAILK